MVKNKISVLLLLCFFSLTVSCAKSISEDSVKSQIVKYAYALVPAYKEGNFDLLVDVSTGDAVSQVSNTYQSYLNGGNLVLDSELLSMEFTEVVLGSGSDDDEYEVKWFEEDKEWRELSLSKETHVKTKERWKYFWIDKDTGNVESVVVTASYDMHYVLNNIDNSLRIIKAEISAHQFESKEGEPGRYEQMGSGGTKSISPH